MKSDLGTSALATGRSATPSTTESCSDFDRLSQRRVVLLLHVLEMGGAERQAFMLADQLRARYGCQVEVWSLSAGEWGRKRGEELQIAIRILGYGTPATAGGILHMTAGLVRRLRSSKIDILVPFLDLPNLLGNLGWRLTPARACVWNARTTQFKTFHPVLDRLALRLTGAIVGNSQAVVRSVREHYGSSRKPSFVVYNGVDAVPAKSTRTEWRDRLGIGDSSFMCCMTGHLTERKDHESLLLAWRQVVDETAAENTSDPPVLVIAGRYEEKGPAVEQSVQRLGLARFVRFPGLVDDVAGLLAASDLGVLSSVYEGCPNALLEYMMAGLPVVATALPCVREIVPKENWDYLVSPQSPDDLARAIVTFMRDPRLCRLAGRANLEMARLRYQPDRMCDGMVSAILAAHRV